MIEIVEKTEKNTFLIGDFNYPSIDWERGTAAGRKARDFLMSMEEKLMAHLVDFPTHTRGNTLDLVITNSPELVIGLEEEGRLGRSDHVLLEMKIGVDNRPTKEDGKEFVDWKKADWKQIRRDIDQVDWRTELEGSTANEAWEKLKEKLKRTVDTNVPKKKGRRSTRPPWLTQEIMRGIRKKKRLWKRARNGQGREQYRRRG